MPVRIINRYLDLTRHFLAQHLKTMLEYRLNFVVAAVSTITYHGAHMLAIYVAMDNAPRLAGWNRDEVFLIFGLLLLSDALAGMFSFNLYFFGSQYVQRGGLDRLLVRPVNPLFSVLIDKFNQDRLGSLALSLVVIGLSVRALGLQLGVGQVVYIAVAVLSGALIITSIALITAVPSFWLMNSTPLMLSVAHNVQFARYPLTVFSKTVRTLFTWVIPFGLCSYYPASYLLGHDIGWMAFAMVPMALGLFALGYRFWTFGLRHYASTGS